MGLEHTRTDELTCRLESTVVSDSSPATGTPTPDSGPGDGQLSRDPRVVRLRLIAIVSGLLGTLCFLALPFLPVSQTTASVQWPQNGSVDSVTAPLMAHSPQRITATLPCALVAELPEDGDLYLVCRSGGRSAQASQWLNHNGYDAINVRGGMDAWFEAGLPMVSDGDGEPYVL